MEFVFAQLLYCSSTFSTEAKASDITMHFNLHYNV